MSLTFRPATRSRRRPLIGLYGLSGTGKTYSALLLARGLVGPEGKIAMIDTENGRGSDYEDKIPNGYEVLDLDEPFSPDHYIEAIDALTTAKPDIGIIDSMSHEWEGSGSVSDMAAAREIKSGKPGLHCWKEPKRLHTKMMLKLLRTPMPVICCLRAKRKSRQVKDEKGNTVIVTDEFTTPKQDGDFIYEMTVHAEIMQDHTLRVTKLGHPALEEVFRTGEIVTIETGKKLALWCAGRDIGKAAAPEHASTAPPPRPASAQPSQSENGRPAPAYHDDMILLHKELRAGLEGTADPKLWWRNHPTGIQSLKESAPKLYDDLVDLAGHKKQGKLGL